MLRIFPSPLYSGERGRGEGEATWCPVATQDPYGIGPFSGSPPHPQPLSPEYGGEGSASATLFRCKDVVDFINPAWGFVVILHCNTFGVGSNRAQIVPECAAATPGFAL